jgi:uncharacterized protein
VRAVAQPVRRTCVGCRTVRELPALIRITADAAGNLLVNPRRAAGRGAYVCTSLRCLAEAWRRRAFSRALRRDLAGVDEAKVREQFGRELGRRCVAFPSVPVTEPGGGGGPRNLTSGRRQEVSAHSAVDKADRGEECHRQQIRRPSGGWDGRR